MDEQSSCFRATNTLRNILLQWKSEVPDPFPLSSARTWLRRYFIANHEGAVNVDEFLSFLQAHDYLKVACYEKRNSPLFYPNDESLHYAPGGQTKSSPHFEYGIPFSEVVGKELYYRSLSLNLLERLTSYLPDQLKSDLHPSLHYKNLLVVRDIPSFPPLKSCKFCSDWLTEIGKHLCHNCQESGINLSLSLLVHLDFLTSCSDGIVLSKENKASVLNDIVRTIVKLLKTFDAFVPPNPTTVCLFKFILRRQEQKKKNRHPPSAWIGNRINVPPSLRDSSVQRSTESEKPTFKAFRRSQSVSPRSRRFSLNPTDLRMSMSFSRPTITPGKLQKVNSDVFNATDCVERPLRLATTLLHPNACFIIACLTAAIRSIRKNANDNNLTADYFPLSSVECMAGLMAPILFPVVPQPKVARNLRLDRSEWREALLTTLFSVDDERCIEPTELLHGIVDSAKLPPQAEALGPVMVNLPPPTLAPLRSSFSRLNVRSPPRRTAAVPLGPCRPKIGIESSSSHPETTSASPMPLQSTLPSTLRCSHLSRKLEPQQRLSSLGKTCELMKLLNGILEDRAMDPKVKLNHLRQFQTYHGDVFWMRFGDVKTAERYFERLNHRIANASTKKTSETPAKVTPKTIGASFWRRVRSMTPRPSK